MKATNMSTLFSKPPTSGLLPATKQKWHENASIRIVSYIIIAAICNGLIVAAAYVSQAKFPLLVIILLSSIPTVVLGIAFAIIQTFDDQTRNLEKIIKSQKKHAEHSLGASMVLNIENGKKVSLLIEDFNTLVKHTGATLNFYASVRGLLEDGYEQTNLIDSFLNKAMRGPLFIQPMEPREFYDLASKGIEQCSTWQAIHQGPISILPDFTYLRKLEDNKNVVKKQRIVILTEEEAKELHDDEKKANFLRATADTQSYWINKEVFYKNFEIPARMRLDDAALHDGRLLILRQRETKLVMLALQRHQDKALTGIINAFDTLNQDIKFNRVSDFKEII